jgi:DNA-binding SARP family transcriptional activator
MDFHILGPLEVLHEGRAISLGGSRQRALLALLLLHANETLTTDRLIDELWGERAPPTAAKLLHVQISRLRKALAAGGGDHHDGPGAVVTRERGYELTLEREQLDAHRFEDLVAAGSDQLAAGHADRAASTLERALSLWRGAPLADAAYERFAQREIARLEELRVTALEQLVDAQLGLGHHADVVGRLQALIGEHPYRERLRAQLMLALYRCDRQADALQAYQDARRALVDELGIEPGERLRELERAVLAHDPGLAPPAADAVQAPPPKEAPRRPAAPRADARRLVSVVFADLADSTALAERLDPESLHGVLDRYSVVCADVLERHGGTVEELRGDAVMGIFGLRERHEDDPLRAVRAALELREAGAALGTELERDHGIHIAMRFGLTSGEVFVGTGARGETLARGDAMNVAAGLGEAAADGEILLGERAYRLVTAEVLAEPLEPLAVRGRQAKVDAWRLLGLKAGDPVPLGSSATPFVARARELGQLRAELARAGAERSCRLVTVVGQPGIGKSRLARELVTEVGEDATVVVGRCLSYGDGIAYRPLAEMISQLAGADPEQWIGELLAGDERVDLIVRRVRGAIGLSGESAQAGETFWAVRRLFEAVARERPLVMVVEDAHWADPTLLDLLEYVVAFSSGSPILLVCLARQELLERRASWAAPQPSASLLALEALPQADALALVGTVAGDELDRVIADRIVATAEGNPLFLEQLLAVKAESELTTLPPSIEAVLAARIDQLDPHERDVLVHASVEGRSFHAGAVAALMAEGEREAVGTALMGLVHKQLVRPDRPEFAGEDAFRFSHALIRDAAYSGMPKRLRASLHERAAGWLKSKSRVPDEILGYHLEQACRYRAELGHADERDRVLAGEAAERLAAAAQAALVRGDAAAAARLLERAVVLLPPEDPTRSALLSTLGATLVEAGRLADADRILTEAIERAKAEDDPRLEARARVEQQLERLHAGTSTGIEQARQVADLALRELERHGDDLGRCGAWRLLAWTEWMESRAGAADEAWRRAATHARRADDERELFEILGWRASAAAFGPTPVPEAIRRCERIGEQVRSSPVAVAVTLQPLGLLHAMTGDFDRARKLVREANEILDELGRMEDVAAHHEALVELLAGRPAEAEARLRPGYERLERMGERALLATTAAMLAQAVYAQERHEEAGELCRASERFAAREDVVTRALWRGVWAKIRAREGERDEAEALGREAVRLLEPTDLLTDRGNALLDLAEVLQLGGRAAEADAAARRSLELYERKGNLVSAARARSWPTVTAPA